MELIDSQEKKLFSDIEKIKNQIAAFKERGFMGSYGNFLPYTVKQADKISVKLKEAGINFEIQKSTKKGYIKVVFSDLLDLPVFLP